MTSQEPRHIALFGGDLSGGGAQRVIVNLAREFCDMGHRVDVVLAQATGVYLPLLPEGVNLVDLGAKRVSLAVFPLIKYLRYRRPEILISHQNHVNAVAIPACRFSGVNVTKVAVEHGPLSRMRKDAPPVRGLLVFWLLKRVLSWADLVIAVSRGMADELSQMPSLKHTRIRAIYNPIITTELIAGLERPIDHPWLSPGSPPVIMSAGRFASPKDFPTLLRAFKKLLMERDARLILLGDGENRPSMESLAEQLKIREKIYMPGFISDPYPWMAKASVFVLSSISEGLPTVLIESMACGTRVVSTDCDFGPREVLEGGRYGKLVPVGDAQAMCRAINDVLDDPIDPEILRTASMKYSSRRVAEEYIRVIDQL